MGLGFIEINFKYFILSKEIFKIQNIDNLLIININFITKL